MENNPLRLQTGTLSVKREREQQIIALLNEAAYCFLNKPLTMYCSGCGLQAEKGSLSLLLSCEAWLYPPSTVIPLHTCSTLSSLLSGEELEWILAPPSAEFRRLLHRVLPKTISRTVFAYQLRALKNPRWEIEEEVSPC